MAEKITVAKLEQKTSEQYNSICKSIDDIITKQKNLTKSFNIQNKLINDIKNSFDTIKDKDIKAEDINKDLKYIKDIQHDDSLKIESFNVTLYSLIEKFKEIQNKCTELEKSMNVIAEKTLLNIERITKIEEKLNKIPENDKFSTLKGLVKDFNNLIENIS